MIKDIVGDDEAGIYSLAYSISQIMTLFNTALMQTLSPWIYKKIKEKKVEELSNIALIAIALVNIVLNNLFISIFGYYVAGYTNNDFVQYFYNLYGNGLLRAFLVYVIIIVDLYFIMFKIFYELSLKISD